MSALEELQKWYHSQCDGNWEHGYGVTIETVDNPGWSLTINLKGTKLAGKEFAVHKYGTDKPCEEWLHCRVENEEFKAYGGPLKLEEMITVFLKWKDQVFE